MSKAALQETKIPLCLNEVIMYKDLRSWLLYATDRA